MGTLRMRDLIKATGVTDRIVRQYIQHGVLPHATGRGTGPVYTEDHLVRLRAIRRLLFERCTLDEIKLRLSRLSPEELARLGAPSPPTTSATSPGAAPSPIATNATAAPVRGAPAQPSSPTPYPAEPWERVTLLPGLELHVRRDAGPLVRRIAEEIHARYWVVTG